MKYADPQETKQVLTRLKTVRGHVAAVERMIEEEKNCEEVLLQLVAIKSAVQKVSIVIAQRYANTCMVDALESGQDKREVINKAIETLMKLHD